MINDVALANERNESLETLRTQCSHEHGKIRHTEKLEEIGWYIER
jgi:hypothetical protein